jgi:toxin ParE1/3/4
VRVRWLSKAVDNLEKIAEYIAEDDPKAAGRVLTRIADSVEILRRFPTAGRPGRVEGTREFVVPALPYLIAYRVKEQQLEILRVLHAARKWPRRLP